MTTCATRLGCTLAEAEQLFGPTADAENADPKHGLRLRDAHGRKLISQVGYLEVCKRLAGGQAIDGEQAAGFLNTSKG